MKNTYILLLLLSSFTIAAQDNRLFENSWYIQSITVDGVDYPEPVPYPNSIIFNENNESFTYSYCEAFMGEIAYSGTSGFELPGDVACLLSDCNTEISSQFGARYKGVYFLESGLTANPFSYQIIDNSDDRTLIITSGDGNVAIYSSEPNFNLNDNKLLRVSIAPNPAASTINLMSSIAREADIIIVDAVGKVVKTIQGNTNQPIDVAIFPKGLYFLNVTTSDGTKQTLKFIKE